MIPSVATRNRDAATIAAKITAFKNFELIAEDSWRNIQSGELEVRPPRCAPIEVRRWTGNW